MSKPFHVPICRQDRSALHPDIAAAFDAAYAALAAAMRVCAHGIDPELGSFSTARAFWVYGLEEWWKRVDRFSPLVTAARMALKPVHATLTLAQQSAKGEPLPSFAGTSGDCAHDVAVKLAGNVVSICIAQPAFLKMELQPKGDEPAELRERRMMEDKWRLIHPHLSRFAVVDGEKLVASMWIEAVLASAAPATGPLEEFSRTAAAPMPRPLMSKAAKALAALAEHPDWTDEQIADAAGCKRTSLYRMKSFKQARRILRGGLEQMPAGTKDGETGDVEAWNDD